MMTPEEMNVLANNHLALQKNDLDGGGVSGEKAAYEILFDTYAQAVTTGVRNSVVAARQLLFRIGPVFVDLEVGRETDSDRASLTGQVLDSSNPGHPPAGVPIILLDRGRRVATTTSNDHGEFRLQFSVTNNLKLSVAIDRESPVHLPITSPAGSKGNSGRARKYRPLGSIANRTIAQ